MKDFRGEGAEEETRGVEGKALRGETGGAEEKALRAWQEMLRARRVLPHALFPHFPSRPEGAEAAAAPVPRPGCPAESPPRAPVPAAVGAGL